MKRHQRRELTFTTSKADQKAIANGKGSQSKLDKAWKALRDQLQDGERIYVEWQKNQFSNWCQMILDDPLDLETLIEGIVIYRARNIHFYAESKKVPRPDFVPKDQLF